MTLSIAAIAGPVATTSVRVAASTSVFALSLAQVAGFPAAGKDDDPQPAAADTQSKGSRQDDAADGNALPPAATTSTDPSLLAAWMMPTVPAAVAVPVPALVKVQADAGVTAAAITAPIATATTATAALSTRTPIDPSIDGGTASPVSVPKAVGADMTLPDAATIASGTTGDASSAPVPVSPNTPSVASSTVVPIIPAALVATPSSAPVPLPTIASAIIALAAPVSPTGVTVTAVQAPTVTDTPAPSGSDPTPTATATATALQIDTRAAPVVALPPAQPPAPLQRGTAIPATATSAIQAFGSAMRAGLAKETRTEATDASAALVGTATHAAATPAVAATGDVQQAPLDLRRENWPHAMIDRIEALRDAADATSTKMRVVPDALGPVEMSVRKDGDTVHVHFAADQAQTRAVLTDAQPRLAAIAEQRGLRLGGSTVDSGSAGTGQQQQQATAQPPIAPPSPIAAAADAAADDDTRLA